MAWTGVMPVIMVPLGITVLILLATGPLMFAYAQHSTVGPTEMAKAFAYIALAALIVGMSVSAVLFVTAVTGDNQIHISKDGFVFPLFMSPFVRFRRKRLWSEVAKIYVQRPSSKSKIDEGDLLFVFRSGECIRLELSGFIEHGIAGSKDKSELEKFILACEVLAENAEIDSEVSDIRDWLRNESNEIGQLSYTEVWERELSNRFHATVFVPLEPGALLRDGKLRVVRQLAFGGLAAVYLVQKEGKELLILKEAVVPPDRDEELKEKALQMFDREARLLAALDHPRIAKVLDHFVESGRNYLLIERISGQNLRQIVNQKGPQPEPVVLGWCVEIAEILVHLHELSPPIIHRDLTPENLILAEDGHIYLIDFGAANEFIGTVTGTVVGKQSFISPEQFRGKASLSSDIYSFGGTMHFLLTGKNPLAMSVASPAQIVESISKQTDAIAVSCTCQEASGRPATARVLKEQLLNALGASVVSESKS